MNPTIYFFIAIATIIFFHELGHYLAYRFFKFKPDLRITWWGIQIGKNVMYEPTVKQMMIISSSGILLGYFVLMLFTSDRYYKVIYLLVSMVDFVNILTLANYIKKSHLTIREVLILEYKNVLKIKPKHKGYDKEMQIN